MGEVVTYGSEVANGGDCIVYNNKVIEMQVDRQSGGAGQVESRSIERAVKENYQRLGKVRVTFKTEGVGIANSSKYEFFFEAGQKVLDFKLKMQEITKQNLYFYLNQSFMPSLDSRLGDLGQCYGRYDQKNNQYELQFIVNGNENRYG